MSYIAPLIWTEEWEALRPAGWGASHLLLEAVPPCVVASVFTSVPKGCCVGYLLWVNKAQRVAGHPACWATIRSLNGESQTVAPAG